MRITFSRSVWANSLLNKGVLAVAAVYDRRAFAGTQESAVTDRRYNCLFQRAACSAHGVTDLARRNSALAAGLMERLTDSDALLTMLV